MRTSASREPGEGSGRGNSPAVRSGGQANVSEPAGSAARDPEGGTHTLSDQAARRTSASRQRSEGSGRGNSHAVRSGRQANVSEPAAGRGSGRGNSRTVRSGRQANVSEPAARRGIQKGELTCCQIRPPGGHQRAGGAARNPEGGTHMLSDQAARQTSASRQRGEGSGRGNSRAVRSGRQADVSEPAARRGIRKGELTRCQIRPPGERQRAGSGARGPEGGTN